MVLKKCEKEDDVLFINASEHYKKEKRQNFLRTGENEEPNDIKEIVDTYQNRPEKIERYSRRVSMEEIEKNDFNLNISRYVSTAKPEPIIDLNDVNEKLNEIEKKATKSLNEHNEYLKELGLKTI